MAVENHKTSKRPSVTANIQTGSTCFHANARIKILQSVSVTYG